jgi:coatomer protein complex subunit alpha (xenin)
MEQFKEDPKRNLELAAYLTHFNLHPLHMLISLRSAMSSAVKLKNFNTAASFSHRLMKLNPKSEHKEQALKVLRVCDTNRTNEVDLTYDERNPFVVCTKSFMPVYRGHPLARCVFCTAAFDPKFRDKCVLSAKLARLGSRVRG